MNGSPSRLDLVEELLVDYRDTTNCGKCLKQASGSRQIASEIRQLRDRGLIISCSKQRCSSCKKVTDHYQFTGRGPSKRRASIPVNVRKKYVRRVGSVDAFTRMPATSLELDHRVPHLMQTRDEDPVDDTNIDARYQLLTPANNQLKNQACRQCDTTGQRPCFGGGVEFWLEGSAATPASCEQCPWAHPEKWRAALHARLRSTAPA